MSINASFSGTFSISDAISGNTALAKLLSNLTYGGNLLQYLQPWNIGVAAPTGASATGSATGGTFSAGTYYWKITALNGTGETTGSTEVSAILTGSTSSVSLAWNAMPGATSYRIYRGTSSNGESVYFTSTTNSFTDTGAAGTSGTVPGSNTTGTTYTPTLTETPLQAVVLHNLSLVNSVQVNWTPTNGSSVNVGTLAPNGVLLLWEPSVATNGGITALTLTASAPGTPVEGLWVS